MSRHSMVLSCLLVCVLALVGCAESADPAARESTAVKSSPSPTAAASSSVSSSVSGSPASTSSTVATSRVSPSASTATSTPPTETTVSSEQLPLPVEANTSSQLITVVAAAPGATDVIVTGWVRDPDGRWVTEIGPVAGVVGSDGIGQASETTSFTPAGTFALTRAFGIEADPGALLPYRQVSQADWWVSDVDSADYNTLVSCDESQCPFDTSVSEQLATISPEYAYAVVLDYNTAPVVPGAGSAFFLHVSAGVPTQGCVAIDSQILVQMIRWLDPAANPVISIGIG